MENNINYANWIGKTVIKHSGKPFKSGEITAKATALTTNPHSGKQGFEIDGNAKNIVDCYQVKLFKNGE